MQEEKVMNEALLKAWIRAQIRLRNFWEDLKSEENGAVEIITMILIVVIVVAVLAIFRERIGQLINTIFDNTKDKLGDLGTMKQS